MVEMALINPAFIGGEIVNDNVPMPAAWRRAAAPQNAAPASTVVDIRHGRLDLDLPNIVTRLERESGILWAHMKHRERACFTPELMRDGQDLFALLKTSFCGRRSAEMPFRYFVWASKADRVWSLGGDLSRFTSMIRERDEHGLRHYAYASIDVLHDNYESLGLPVMTVALINGDAVGGGFEAMLTSDLVIAERHAKFGLPEILFNLFPGMGAHAFLARKVGKATAKMLIEDGKTRSAEEMVELGLVDIVCETGESEATLRRFAEDNQSRFNTERLLRRAIKRVDPVGRDELIDIVDMWVELALELTDTDLRRMDCLARHQEKKRAKV
ncbi:MAG: enoyl-CoA hydratase/isomerase family protein [Geminicoccaceae bacterium]|nr:enoyl-CoA hydratase/isomerase family protein [Geminicoccaceae bacterium]